MASLIARRKPDVPGRVPSRRRERTDMTERLLMSQVREILRLKSEQGLPRRAIARACGVGLGTVSEYCRRAQRAALTWPLPADQSGARARCAGDVQRSLAFRRARSLTSRSH